MAKIKLDLKSYHEISGENDKICKIIDCYLTKFINEDILMYVTDENDRYAFFFSHNILRIIYDKVANKYLVSDITLPMLVKILEREGIISWKELI